jgi:hypothetical protein
MELGEGIGVEVMDGRSWKGIERKSIGRKGARREPGGCGPLSHRSGPRSESKWSALAARSSPRSPAYTDPARKAGRRGEEERGGNVLYDRGWDGRGRGGARDVQAVRAVDQMQS